MWMGIFWMVLGVFFLIRGGFVLPKIQIELGWVVLFLGGMRVWWWWKSVEAPKRRRARLRAETKALMEEGSEPES